MKPICFVIAVLFLIPSALDSIWWLLGTAVFFLAAMFDPVQSKKPHF